MPCVYIIYICMIYVYNIHYVYTPCSNQCVITGDIPQHAAVGCCFRFIISLYRKTINSKALTTPFANCFLTVYNFVSTISSPFQQIAIRFHQFPNMIKQSNENV